MLRILGIETSCDETAAAVVYDGTFVASNVIASQIKIHEKFGGVVPEIASRKHMEIISQVVDEALKNASVNFNDIDAIAVTNTPGLVGALLVGVSYAKGLSYSLKKPLVSVNHIEGHICANYIENPNFKPPFMCLVVSGGHTHLVHVLDFSKYKVLGKTRDDAAGEAFDKAARALGLGYPGGPKIDLAAKNGDENAIIFPQALSDSLDFSFSGLKSSVLNYINKCNMTREQIVVENVAASFQKAVVEVLVKKTIAAAKALNIKKIALAGGVSCNSALRAAMKQACLENEIELNIPSPVYCTDNAAMIASCGYFNYKKGSVSNLWLNAYANSELV